MAFGNRPFGLREVKITNADGSGAVALQAAMILHVTPRIAATEFMAEGIVLEVSSVVTAADWELEAGGISLDALAKLLGNTTTSGGVAPNRTLTLAGDTGLALPYVRIYGRAVGDGVDDIHCKLWQCKLTSIEGTFRVGEFWITSCAGVAVHGMNGLFDFVQHETAVAL